MLVALCLSGFADAASAQDAHRAIDSMRRAYQSMWSVHMLAEATITRSLATGQTGNGTFEYWAEGDKYRIKCTTDPLLQAMPDVEYSFDGAEFRFLDHASGILARQRGNVAELATALPNPLFVPLTFLSDESDSCNACALSLEQAQDDQRWHARLGALSDSPAGTKGDLGATVRLSWKKDGIPAVFRILTNGFRADRVDRIRSDGSLLTRATLKYSAAGDVLPRWISLVAFDDRGVTPESSVEFAIKVLEVNQPIPAEVFRIAGDGRVRVWNSDAKDFETQPPRH